LLASNGKRRPDPLRWNRSTTTCAGIAMLYRVKHTTVYHYSDTVSVCHNQVHLTPRAHPRQLCSEHRLMVRPRPNSIVRRSDYYGNVVSAFSVQGGHQRLTVTAKSLVDVQPAQYPTPAETPTWEQVRDGMTRDLSSEGLAALQFVFPSPCVRGSTELTEYATPSFPAGRTIMAGILDLTKRIYTEFKFDPTATTVNTPPTEVLRSRRGVCQDFAHLMIACLRSQGLAARYVSGYLLTLPPPGKPRLVGADASHAWVSVYVPGFGWIDADPTNNVLPSDQHVTLAWGRDYADVCPIMGVFHGGGTETVSVSVDVCPMEPGEVVDVS